LNRNKNTKKDRHKKGVKAYKSPAIGRDSIKSQAYKFSAGFLF
jgi:hypothetical protein